MLTKKVNIVYCLPSFWVPKIPHLAFRKGKGFFANHLNSANIVLLDVHFENLTIKLYIFIISSMLAKF